MKKIKVNIELAIGFGARKSALYSEMGYLPSSLILDLERALSNIEFNISALGSAESF